MAKKGEILCTKFLERKFDDPHKIIFHKRKKNCDDPHGQQHLKVDLELVLCKLTFNGSNSEKKILGRGIIIM